MEATAFAAIAAGAVLGAWLRWLLAVRLNGVLPQLPLGTLAANLVGGLLVGVAIAYFQRHPHVAPELRLFAITGFLGALTTFSTFSAEIVHLLMRGEYAWAAGSAALHLFGSLMLTAVGIALVSALSKAAA